MQSKIKFKVMANLEIKDQCKDGRGNDSGLVFAYLELENSQTNSVLIPDEEITTVFQAAQDWKEDNKHNFGIIFVMVIPFIGRGMKRS